MIRTYFRKTYKLYCLVSAFFGIVIFVQSCNDDVINAQSEFIAGNITFIDANYMQNGSSGYYAIALFPNVTNPFCQQPYRKDTLWPVSGTTTLYYKMTNVETGSYYIGVAWILPSPYVPNVLGTYGCDRQNIPPCSTYTKIDFPSYSGAGSVNFQSYTQRTNYVNHCQ